MALVYPTFEHRRIGARAVDAACPRCGAAGRLAVVEREPRVRINHLAPLCTYRERVAQCPACRTECLTDEAYAGVLLPSKRTKRAALAAWFCLLLPSFLAEFEVPPGAACAVMHSNQPATGGSRRAAPEAAARWSSSAAACPATIPAARPRARSCCRASRHDSARPGPGSRAAAWGGASGRGIMPLAGGPGVTVKAMARRPPMRIAVWSTVALAALAVGTVLGSVRTFRQVSGAMLPTLQAGDFVVANTLAFGITLPIGHAPVLQWSGPRRGDLVVFRFPENPAVPLVMRVVGLPGDRLVYADKRLSVNGAPATGAVVGTFADTGAAVVEERLGETTYRVLHQPQGPAIRFSLVVPEGQYFVLGDHRDNSRDSRYWGGLPRDHLIGRAFWTYPFAGARRPVDTQPAGQRSD